MACVTPAAREYFRAFYDHNRARFVAALALTVLYFLNPLFFVMSSVWGSEITLLALALVVTFAFVLSKNMFGMCLAASISCLVSPYAVFVVPVVGFYVVYATVKSVINIVKAKPSFDSVMKDPAYYNVFYAPLCAVLGFAVMYLVSLPAYFADGAVGFADSNYFSSCFRKQVGCTPSEFRETALR